MKIGFICPTVPGHLNPMTALARHLQARNHEVVFLYSSSAKTNGLSMAADIVERSFGVTKKAPLPEEAIHGGVNDR